MHRLTRAGVDCSQDWYLRCAKTPLTISQSAQPTMQIQLCMSGMCLSVIISWDSFSPACFAVASAAKEIVMCGAAPTNIDLRPSGNCTCTACTMHLAQACYWSYRLRQRSHKALGTGGAHLRIAVLHDAGESHLKTFTQRQRCLLLMAGLEDKGQMISPDIAIARWRPASTPATPPEMLAADPTSKLHMRCSQ